MTEVHTQVLGGTARVLSSSATLPVMGGWMRTAAVSITGAVSYRQWSEACTLHVTLERSFASQKERGGRSTPPSDRKGAVSFLPANAERAGEVLPGTVLGVEVCLPKHRIEEVCEQRLDKTWQGTRDAHDARAFAFVEALDRALRGAGEPLLIDTMMVGLARHLGQRHGGADRRYDDAWLHPAALKRVVERIRSTPADPPGLAELAALAGLGVSAFLRGFRGSIGATPAAFSRRVRTEQARGLVEATDMPLSEVALHTGFHSASHLARVFTAQFGHPPGARRTLMRTVTKSA